MFLFTTPPASAAAPPAPAKGGAAPAGPVVEAIRDGASRTGAGFDYLLATAQRESALDPRAKNGGSSATGLFQFIEQTWLGTLKSDGPRLGLGDYAAAITARGDGTYAVGDAATRQAILDLRNDPGVSSAMAGALTQHNRDALQAELGREPSRGELYAAHVLGARGASSLIQTAAEDPARAAALDFPAAAGANRGIFYERGGRPRGAAEVVAALSAGQDASTATAAPPAAGFDRALAFARADGSARATAPDRLDGQGLRSLFQTDARRGPISEGVARLWAARAAAPAARGPAYFPRSEGEPAAGLSSETRAEAAAATAAATSPGPVPASAGPALVGAPLPPRRPEGLPGALPRAASPAAATPSTATVVRRAAGSPLDLAAFLRPNRT